MKFNPTFLVILFFFFVCLFIFVWTKHGRRIRRWLQDYFPQRRGPRNLKPKSPEDCPLCNKHICFLPHRPKPEVVDISAAGRIFGHHHTTITRWIERCGRHSERLYERLFQRALTIGHLQLVELVTKVKQDSERL